MEVLQKLKIELPYDPAIPLLGIYPEKTIIQKEKNKYRILCIYVEPRKMVQMNWLARQKQRHRCREQMYGHQGGKVGGGGGWWDELGDWD